MMKTRLPAQTKAASPSFFAPVVGGVLQRKCACGGSAGVTSEFEDRNRNQLSPQRSTRKAEAETQISYGVPRIVHEVLSSRGQPLSRETRAFFEPRFGHDFSNVRVHANQQAALSAAQVNAVAYTVGADVVLAPANISRDLRRVDPCWLHELAHTIQQGTDYQGGFQTLSLAQPDDSFERHADALAAHVMSPSAAAFHAAPALANHRAQRSLQRQRCKKADDTIVTGPLLAQEPNVPCNPSGETLDTVRAAAAVPSEILGVTGPVTGHQKLNTRS